MGQAKTKRAQKAAGKAKKPYENDSAKVDGLYGASQFHLSAKRPFTDDEGLMINYAVRLPMSGFVDCRIVAPYRVIVTTTCEPRQREAFGRLYAKAIDAVLKREWVNEYPTMVPPYPYVGRPWDELTDAEKAEVRAQNVDQYPFMDNEENWHWWKADGKPKTLDLIRKALGRRHGS